MNKILLETKEIFQNRAILHADVSINNPYIIKEIQKIEGIENVFKIGDNKYSLEILKGYCFEWEPLFNKICNVIEDELNVMIASDSKKIITTK